MQRATWAGLAAAVAVLSGAAWYWVSDADAAANPSAQAAANANGALASQLPGNAAYGGAGGLGKGQLPPNPNSPLSAEGQRSRQEQLAFWQGRYERAEQVYANYRDATRYPPESHPISQHPDQVRPFAAISEDTKLRNAKGEPVKGIQLRSTQERVFASGADTVKLTISAVDDAGQMLPITINNAAAQSLAESKTLATVIQAPMVFDDSGQGADAIAGDGTYSARLQPAAQGFANFAGTIRVLVQVSAKGQQGVAQFDVVYTPDVPAVWSGVREALEAGSLNIYLKAQVRVAGRYVVSARVDDANGQPFALLQFNDELAAGPREFKLQLFGALVRDKKPAFPLRLRDVDGFLLYADRFPDRAMMARLPGLVHTTARYSPESFSAAEWTSQERDRYLVEYGKDAEQARSQVERLSGR